VVEEVVVSRELVGLLDHHLDQEALVVVEV